MSSSTKNRRSSAKATTTPKETITQTRASKRQVKGGGVKATLDLEQFKNTVVGRRLAFISDDKKRADLAARMVAGESVSKLAAEAGLTQTRAAYCLRQEAVSAGLVPVCGTDLKSLLAAGQEKTFSDAAWVACRSGLTPQKIAKMIAES